MATKMIDAETGAIITGQIKLIFVCDMCGNTTDFYNGMPTYSGVIKNTTTTGTFCSEICARKAVA